VVCDKKEGGKTVWDIIMFWILWFLCTRKLGLGNFVALCSFFPSELRKSVIFSTIPAPSSSSSRRNRKQS
jgi:hypothetical protein